MGKTVIQASVDVLESEVNKMNGVISHNENLLSDLEYGKLIGYQEGIKRALETIKYFSN